MDKKNLEIFKKIFGIQLKISEKIGFEKNFRNFGNFYHFFFQMIFSLRNPIKNCEKFGDIFEKKIPKSIRKKSSEFWDFFKKILRIKIKISEIRTKWKTFPDFCKKKLPNSNFRNCFSFLFFKFRNPLKINLDILNFFKQNFLEN